MEVLKWIGYSVAAILVLAVVLGGGIFIATVVAVGGLAVSAILLVAIVAVVMKESVEDYFKTKKK